MEVFAQDAIGVVGAEYPIVEFGYDPAFRFRLREEGRFGGDEDFARTDAFEKSRQFEEVYFGSAELAGRDIDVRKSRPCTVARNGGEVVVFVGAEKMRVGGGAGRDDPGDFAPNEFFAGRGFFDLIADSDAISAPDQARDIAFGRMIRHAAHWYGGAFFFVAGGEGDFQLARGQNRVVEEELIEVAEAIHQQGAGNLLFNRVILPH